MNNELNLVFEKFSQDLKHRFENRIHNNEHIIRDMLIEAFIDTKIEEKQVKIEYPLPGLSNARVDLRVIMEELELIAELKFHRPNTGDTIRPFPMMAGTVFNDIFKMAEYKTKFPEAKYFLIYVADKKMVNYFRNNCLSDYFDGEQTSINESYIDRCVESNIDRSDTFKNNAKASRNLIDCRVERVFGNEFTTGYYLRIHEIMI